MVTSKIIDLTPELAERFLERNGANRPVKRENVDRIARDILAKPKRWVFDGNPITFDGPLDEDGIMRSGQHRCLAVVQAGKTDPDISVQVMIVEGVSPESTLTANSGVPTTSGDTLNMAGYADSMGLAALVRLHYGWMTGNIVTVSSYLGRNMTLTSQELLAHLADNPNLVEALTLGARMQRGIAGYPKSALSLFAHEARRVDGAAALTFVSLVSDRIREGGGDPLVALDAKGMSHLRAQYGTRKAMPPALAMFCVSRAWNAWRRREPLSAIVIRSDETKIPTLK